MVKYVTKRDGRIVTYDREKIAIATAKAMKATQKASAEGALEVGSETDIMVAAARIAATVEAELESRHLESPGIEVIQDFVEKALMNHGFPETAKAYILYRANRTRVRDSNSALMRVLDEITNADAKASDLKRDNANVDGNTAMGSMLQIGASAAKSYNEMYLLRPEHAKAFRDGYMYIHDFDFYSLTTTCTQIDILKLFHGGFSTGHGYLREPQSIQSYAALAAIAIQSNQNDQHRHHCAA